MRFISASFPCFAWLGGALFTLAVFAPAQADEYRLSQPLDEWLVVREQLTSGEIEEVPPEPVPPSEYIPLGSRAPELVAEEILQLRDTLGSPWKGRLGFRPMTLANQSDEHHAAPAPWEDDRHDFRERLQGMASRPVQPQPWGVPYGVAPSYPHGGANWPWAGLPPYNVPPHPMMSAPVFQTHPEPAFDPRHAPAHLGELNAQPIDLLRETARQLEEAAHQLECNEQYERADQIRQMAEQLRQDARRASGATGSPTLRKAHPAAAIKIEAPRGGQRTRFHASPVEALEMEAERSEAEAFETSEPGANCPACPTRAKTRFSSTDE